MKMTVTGNGYALADPTYYEISCTITTNDKTVQAVRKAHIPKSDEANNLLISLGIQPEQINSSFRISECTKYNTTISEDIHCGYSAKSSLTIRLLPSDCASDVIAKLVDAGATGLSGPIAVLDDQNKTKAQSEARHMAYNDAEQKAKHLMSLAGVAQLHPHQKLTISSVTELKWGNDEEVYGKGSNVARRPKELVGGVRVSLSLECVFEV